MSLAVRPRPCQRRAERGFTLLETLVALTVFGFLMVGLVFGVRTGLAFWNAQTSRIAQTAELDSVARVLRTVLTTIPIQPASLAAPLSIRFTGGPRQIVFVGQLPTGLGVTRRVDLTLYLQAGRLVISWTPHRHDLSAEEAPAAIVTELIRGVERLELAYWGRAIQDSPADWLAEWSGPALPALIRVRMSFPDGDRRHWPDLVVAPPLWYPEN